MYKLRHIGIAVSDLEESLKFYKDLLGFKVVSDMLEDTKFINSLMTFPVGRVRIVKLLAGECIIELLDFYDVKHGVSNDMCNIGYTHIALTVKDLDILYDKLSHEGIMFFTYPKINIEGTAKLCFCCDPDLNIIELVEEFYDS